MGDNYLKARSLCKLEIFNLFFKLSFNTVMQKIGTLSALQSDHRNPSENHRYSITYFIENVYVLSVFFFSRGARQLRYIGPAAKWIGAARKRWRLFSTPKMRAVQVCSSFPQKQIGGWIAVVFIYFFFFQFPLLPRRRRGRSQYTHAFVSSVNCSSVNTARIRTYKIKVSSPSYREPSCWVGFISTLRFKW